MGFAHFQLHVKMEGVALIKLPGSSEEKLLKIKLVGSSLFVCFEETTSMEVEVDIKGWQIETTSDCRLVVANPSDSSQNLSFTMSNITLLGRWKTYLASAVNPQDPPIVVNKPKRKHYGGGVFSKRG